MVEPFHWALWAIECRDSHNLGYPRTSLAYTPPRRGSEGVNRALPTDEDNRIAYLIGRGVRALRDIDAHGAAALVEWHGAYPGAPDRRKDRILRIGLNPRRAHEVIRRHERFVEGFVAASAENS